MTTSKCTVRACLVAEGGLCADARDKPGFPVNRDRVSPSGQPSLRSTGHFFSRSGFPVKRFSRSTGTRFPGPVSRSRPGFPVRSARSVPRSTWTRFCSQVIPVSGQRFPVGSARFPGQRDLVGQARFPGQREPCQVSPVS